jgi:hypothetical protein
MRWLHNFTKWKSNRNLNMKLWAWWKKKTKKRTRKEEKQEKEREWKRKLWGEKTEQTKGNGPYTTSSKSCEIKGKKTKVNNLCITSLKSYERREKNIQPPFHLHSPQDKRKKEKPHIPSPKYMVGIM